MRAVRIAARVPRPLVPLLLAVAVIGTCWALLIPVAQAPDEDAHFGYAQVVAEELRLPDESPGPTYSREQRMAAERSNSFQTAAQLATKPEWSALADRQWSRATGRLPDSARGEGGHADALSGPNSARSNPPLYYLLEAVPYRAASAGDILDRWFLMRLWSALLLLVTVVGTWLLIGELTGGRQLLQLAGAALVGLQPMAAFVSASVNPDALLMASWAFAFWLGVRILRRGLTTSTAVALGAVTAVAILTKATSYALLPGVVAVLAIALLRRREGRLGAIPAVASAAALAVPVGAWLLLSRSLDRSPVNKVPSGGGGGAGEAAGQVADVGLLNYLWQFYLPKLPFQGGIPQIERLPVFDVWTETGWGAFGWLEVRFPEPVYVVLGVLTIVLVGGGLVALVRRRQPGDLAIAGFMGIVALTLVAGLHWVEHRSIVHEGVSFNQGRYLLPILPLLGVCAAGALSLLGTRLRAAAVGVLVGGLVSLQFLSLAIVAARFYA